MVSQKQLDANRRNALQSTGPQTPQGKAQASRNAMKHGLLSQQVLIDDEDGQEFEAFRVALTDRLVPEGELECLLADRVVAAAWRLRRALRIESDLMQSDLDQVQDASDDAMGIVAFRHYGHADQYLKLSRYEAHIERGLYKALHELQRLQAARQGEPVATPAVLDVTVTGGFNGTS